MELTDMDMNNLVDLLADAGSSTWSLFRHQFFVELTEHGHFEMDKAAKFTGNLIIDRWKKGRKIFTEDDASVGTEGWLGWEQFFKSRYRGVDPGSFYDRLDAGDCEYRVYQVGNILIMVCAGQRGESSIRELAISEAFDARPKSNPIQYAAGK